MVNFFSELKYQFAVVRRNQKNFNIQHIIYRRKNEQVHFVLLSACTIFAAQKCAKLNRRA